MPKAISTLLQIDRVYNELKEKSPKHPLLNLMTIDSNERKTWSPIFYQVYDSYLFKNGSTPLHICCAANEVYAKDLIRSVETDVLCKILDHNFPKNYLTELIHIDENKFYLKPELVERYRQNLIHINDEIHRKCLANRLFLDEVEFELSKNH